MSEHKDNSLHPEAPQPSSRDIPSQSRLISRRRLFGLTATAGVAIAGQYLVSRLNPGISTFGTELTPVHYPSKEDKYIHTEKCPNMYSQGDPNIPLRNVLDPSIFPRTRAIPLVASDTPASIRQELEAGGSRHELIKNRLYNTLYYYPKESMGLETHFSIRSKALKLSRPQSFYEDQFWEEGLVIDEVLPLLSSDERNFNGKNLTTLHLIWPSDNYSVALVRYGSLSIIIYNWGYIASEDTTIRQSMNWGLNRLQLGALGFNINTEDPESILYERLLDSSPVLTENDIEAICSTEPITPSPTPTPPPEPDLPFRSFVPFTSKNNNLSSNNSIEAYPAPASSPN